MKEIYIFKLCDIDNITDKVKSDLSLIAYLIYEEIICYSYGLSNPVLVNNDSLKYNNIREYNYDGINKYQLRYDHSSKYGYMYNPTVFNEYSFGITVSSEMINEGELLKILKAVQMLIGTDYNFSIDVVRYNASSYDDESKRIDAINKYYGNDNLRKGHKLSRNKFGSFLTLIGGMGR